MTVRLASIFGPSLGDSSRIPEVMAAASHDAQNLTSEKEVVISFEGIETISASVASEMLRSLHAFRATQPEMRYRFTGVNHAHLRVLTRL